jgi:hypothetical protein
MTLVTAASSARYFFTTTIWARKSTNGHVERVSGEDHKVELRRRAEQPVELRQRVVQIGDDKAAHMSQCLQIMRREKRMIKITRRTNRCSASL